MVRVLHFADAHIDMANYGKHDPSTGMPMRVMDFLKSLDEIVDTAVEEKVDLVIFAGDAYKDRSPAPTFQREWGRRMMRLSAAGIPTIMLVGNHDMSPGFNRANAMTEFQTLEPPNLHLVAEPMRFTPDDLNGAPVQVIALPWIARSGLLAALDVQAVNFTEVNDELEERLTTVLKEWMAGFDPELPTILTAHASVQGAKYGGERTVMLGGDLVYSPAFLKQPGVDYVALGHIHKHQDVNPDSHPPIVYPGSIERVDFGEAADKKYFVIAQVENGKTELDWRELKNIRRFIDLRCELTADDTDITPKLLEKFPSAEQLKDAVVRLTVEYPLEVEPLIDDAALREVAAEAFEFSLVKRPQREARLRLGDDDTISSKTPMELLEIFWDATHKEAGGFDDVKNLAEEIFRNDS